MKGHDTSLLIPNNLRQLAPREQTILRLRYGLEGPRQTLGEIAAVFDVSPSTIRRTEARAWRKLEHRPQARPTDAGTDTGTVLPE